MWRRVFCMFLRDLVICRVVVSLREYALDLGLVNFDGCFSVVTCGLGVIVSNTSPRDVTEAVNCSLSPSSVM